MPDAVVLCLFNAALTVAVAVPYWGPGVLLGTVAWMWWQLRPTGHHRPVRTRVSDRVRACVRTRRGAGPDRAVTCTDTSPDVSDGQQANVSGQEPRGDAQ